MKALVVYTSLTGNTKRMAEGLYYSLKIDNKTLMDVKDNPNYKDYDLIIVGYWVDKAGPCEAIIPFMKSIEGKNVFVFATLSYLVDSPHAFDSIQNGVKMVSEKNNVIGNFIGNGSLSKELLKQFEKMPKAQPHSMNPEKRIRLNINKTHPTPLEIAYACERLNERVDALIQLKSL